MLDKLWITIFPSQQKQSCQPVTDCTYWPVIVPFNNRHITTFSHKATTGEDFEEIHQVVLYGIRKNMSSLVQFDNYGAMNTTDSTTMGYYENIVFSEDYTL